MPVTLAFWSGTPGLGEILIVFIAILLLFGPRRLPEIARTIGKALEELRRASQDFRDQIMRLDETPPRDVPSEELPPSETVPGDAARLNESVTPDSTGLPNASKEPDYEAGKEKNGLAG
jgi:TatA/E family protein of Tat protein translocase